ncbi:hypothetical protein Ahy_B04g073393 [Arachis hypogaea]|uniref:CCHC-type domain-containing protein n=1 Tax=Arachis hypogaea TaxID=3818 RepID=A0A444ZQB3_ARAHY|nr:hypothetical protein Ahy_B04g073393 [Arachis hypogaea]
MFYNRHIESNFLRKFKAPYLQKLIVNIGHVFSELVTSKLHANQRTAGNIQVSCFDIQNEVFKVHECPNGVEYAMDLCRQRCDCGEFRARFRPLGNPTTWSVYHGLRFVGNLFLRQVSKYQPRMTHFLNEMDTRMLRDPKRCKQCGVEGYSRSRCRHVIAFRL